MKRGELYTKNEGHAPDFELSSTIQSQLTIQACNKLGNPRCHSQELYETQGSFVHIELKNTAVVFTQRL